MANAYQQIDMIAAEALMIMSDSMTIVPLTSRDKTSDFMVRPNGYSVGDTVRIKQRPDYEAKEFTSAISIQDIRESKRSMTIEKHFDISVEIGAKEKALDFESLSEQVIAPAARRLAEKVDRYVGGKILEGAGLYASDTLFESAADVALARKAATIQQLNPDGRFCLTTLDLEATILGQTWFNQSQTRGSAGEATLASGYMGGVMGMQFYSSIATFGDESTAHTAGNGTTTTDNTAGEFNAVGSSTLQIDSLTNTINAGDRIQIAGVRRPLIAAAQATATATTVSLVDPITEIIPDGAAVTVIGSAQSLTYQGAIFDSNAMAVAMPLLDPASSNPSMVISDNGVSIRVVQGYDMTAKKETLSLDLLVGATAYDPRRITLLAGY